MGYENHTINAWRRENGRVGVRNHVIILPVDDISNAACEAVGNNVKGTMALAHSYGRLQFGEDLVTVPARIRSASPGLVTTQLVRR